MAYSKQNFRDGDILTAEQLNRMEEGILNAEGGTAGADGFSPTIDARQTEDGVTLEITDKNGTKRVSVQNGKTPKIQVKAVTGDAGTEAKVEQSGTPEEARACLYHSQRRHGWRRKSVAHDGSGHRQSHFHNVREEKQMAADLWRNALILVWPPGGRNDG